MFNLLGVPTGVAAATGVAANLRNAATTKISGDLNETIAEQGTTDSVERQIRMNNHKEMLNWAKLPSTLGASASSEAVRTAGQ